MGVGQGAKSSPLRNINMLRSVIQDLGLRRILWNYLSNGKFTWDLELGVSCAMPTGPGLPWILAAAMWTEVSVGAHCCNTVNRGHCWGTMLQHREPRSLLGHTVATPWTEVIVGAQCFKNVNVGHCWISVPKMASDRMIATMILDTTVDFDINIALLCSWLPCWRHRKWCGVRTPLER
jgi:hypothetical protein